MKKKIVIGSIVVVVLTVIGIISVVIYNNDRNKSFVNNYDQTLNIIANNTIQDANIHSMYLQITELGALNGMNYEQSYTSLLDGNTRKKLADNKNMSRENDIKIVKLMNELKHHSNKFNEAYADIERVYSDYNSLQNQTINVATYSSRDADEMISLSRKITDELTKLKKIGLD